MKYRSGYRQWSIPVKYMTSREDKSPRCEVEVSLRAESNSCGCWKLESAKKCSCRGFGKERRKEAGRH